MTIARQFIKACNLLLEPINLRIDSITAEKLEKQRLRSLEAKGHFNVPICEAPLAFESEKFKEILSSLDKYKINFESLKDKDLNSVKYDFANPFYTSPDTEVLYTIIRNYKPRVILEIGCGNSTKIMRQAIFDAQLNTQILSIDPEPRVEIADFSDQVYLQPVETLSGKQFELFNSLVSGDILFIDSSHAVKTGNDVVFLYLHVLPQLKSGVLIHIHDIFLPYDYPRAWVIEHNYGWNEQYLVQCLLTFGNAFEVLWAGHFLQKTLNNFEYYFPNLNNRSAQSLWLRKN